MAAGSAGERKSAGRDGAGRWPRRTLKAGQAAAARTRAAGGPGRTDRRGSGLGDVLPAGPVGSRRSCREAVRSRGTSGRAPRWPRRVEGAQLARRSRARDRNTTCCVGSRRTPRTGTPPPNGATKNSGARRQAEEADQRKPHAPKNRVVPVSANRLCPRRLKRWQARRVAELEGGEIKSGAVRTARLRRARSRRAATCRT